MESGPFSYANLSNAAFIEELYAKYCQDKESVDPSWRQFFEGMDFGAVRGPDVINVPVSGSPSIELLANAYRKYGHLEALTNPISLEKPSSIPMLDYRLYGFSSADEEVEGIFGKGNVGDVIDELRRRYCGTVGYEYMGFCAPEVEAWLKKHIESETPETLSKEEKIRIFKELNRSELFESFIHIKYPGQKRFSLEGGETVIPLLAEMIEQGCTLGIEEGVIAMAHRGRLNILANILGKSYSMIFHEFEDGYQPSSIGSGDVKYHKGFSSDVETYCGKKVHLSIPANPSHLESVDPVLEGYVRARQELSKSHEPQKTVVPILIHGDSAVAGQGVIYETLQLSNVNGYSTGGTIHIVINNQVGFTASAKETRSTRYCTDIAKAFGAPVFHVNAEDPEGCVYAGKLAMSLRQEFGIDVFIELNCYRKYGHNETDEPGFTQPKEYQLIKQKELIRTIYLDKLIKENIITKEEADNFEKSFHDDLTKALSDAQQFVAEAENLAKVREAKETHVEEMFEPHDTHVSLEKLREYGKLINSVPSDFSMHSKLRRLFSMRNEFLDKDPSTSGMDWGFAENLAFGSLAAEGVHIRLSGQDCKRGTFSHRHAVLIDQNSAEPFTPLNQINPEASVDVYNSILSEYAVMAFEYGYAMSYPKSLVLWEGQFGDFANGAQILIDQYLSSAEQKWGRGSPLTLLLPHGYEGMGPEHSSARVERFLQLSAQLNMNVAMPSTAAQYFHVLRRQGLRKVKKPLIVFTPKNLLRFAPSLCSLKDLSEGSFEEVIDDKEAPKKPKHLIFVTGKVYYDLVSAREKLEHADSVIIRIEQLYPLHEEKIKALIEKYKGVKDYIWVQEEHKNQGAWSFISPRIRKLLPEKMTLQYIGRAESASTAAGSQFLHKKELEAFIKQAFSVEE